MTTIACDGKSMAGDGRSRTRCGIVQDTDKVKVRRLSDGRILGHSGTAYDTDTLVEWLNAGGETKSVPTFDKDCFAALILNLDGTCTSLNWDGRTCPANLPTSIGTGEEVALGAMAFGATAEQAVEIGCRLDSGSGGKITVLHLEAKLREVG